MTGCVVLLSHSRTDSLDLSTVGPACVIGETDEQYTLKSDVTDRLYVFNPNALYTKYSQNHKFPDESGNATNDLVGYPTDDGNPA